MVTNKEKPNKNITGPSGIKRHAKIANSRVTVEM